MAALAAALALVPLFSGGYTLVLLTDVVVFALFAVSLHLLLGHIDPVVSHEAVEVRGPASVLSQVDRALALGFPGGHVEGLQGENVGLQRRSDVPPDDRRIPQPARDRAALR